MYAMRRWVEVLFLRFYAANLMRRRRAEPAYAYRDAVTQLGVVGCLVILICTAMTALLVARNWPQHLYDPDGWFVGSSSSPRSRLLSGRIGRSQSTRIRRTPQTPTHRRPPSDLRMYSTSPFR